MNTINNCNIGIIGLGYVGLPLAVEFSKKYPTVGYDINEERVKNLNIGIDETLEVSNEELQSSNINFSTSLNDLKNCNIFIITVPTPIDEHNNPDLGPLENASRLVGKILKIGDVVIYESTVFPGATKDYCVPILSKESNLEYNKDFFCGYSPERINPGDKEHSLTNIKKITSGSNKETADLVDKLYSSIIQAGTQKVSSIEVCEAAKVIENIQRDVNIALINELSMIFNIMNLDTSEVLEAASTKWNFLNFQPGLVGGHCIGVDPYYLTYKAKEIGYDSQIILAGRRINEEMSKYIANNTIIELTKKKINVLESRVAIFGATFKENCPDIRNTKVPDIINHLNSFGCKTIVVDNWASEKQLKDLYGIDLNDIKELKDIDAIIVAVSHSEFKNISIKTFNGIFRGDGIIIDIKSIYSKQKFDNTNIYHWRL